MENEIKKANQVLSKRGFKLEYNPKTKSNYPVTVVIDHYKYGFQTIEKAMIFCMEKALND